MEPLSAFTRSRSIIRRAKKLNPRAATKGAAALDDAIQAVASADDAHQDVLHGVCDDLMFRARLIDMRSTKIVPVTARDHAALAVRFAVMACGEAVRKNMVGQETYKLASMHLRTAARAAEETRIAGHRNQRNQTHRRAA